jgi:SAM-dependent methyltransferase
MSTPLEFTGERFVPGTEGEIAHEHWHRYAFARRFVAGRRVVDVACGEGYGSAHLAAVAREVVGVDIDATTIAHARAAYATRSNLRFVASQAAALPLPAASVDVIVSFETVEHLDAADQPRMIAEFARVLAPRGVLVLSSPNRPEYSEARNYVNPFHLCELNRVELARLLDTVFAAQRWYRQRRYLGSALWAEDTTDVFEAWSGDANDVASSALPAATYFIVIAARDAAALPPPGPALSLFTDGADREMKRIDEQVRELLRQDALVKERDVALDRQTAHIRHLEGLVAERERIVVERDRQVSDLNLARGALEDECQRLERAIAAQERIIAYRQSARWWLALPRLRARLWWDRFRGA